MGRRAVRTEAGPEPGTYNQAVVIEHNGLKIIEVSGTCGDPPMNFDEEEKKAFLQGNRDIGVQTTRALENIVAILGDEGATMKAVAKVRAYIADFDENFAGFSEAYNSFFRNFEREELPARAAVGVARLPLPGEDTKVMIEATAYIAADADYLG